MAKNFYVTTPIYYVNGNPHVGSAYTTVACDVLSRYKKTKGYDTYFLTGTDEHGQKIEEAAKKKGITPKELVDSVAPEFKNMWKELNIDYDDFIRTTESRHKESVRKIFKKVNDNGDIYKGNYEGLYCVSCENFVPKNQAEDNKCPDCGKELRTVKEESYFFKMSEYGDKLLKHIEENPDFIQPEYRKNEVISFIEQGLTDLSVSRNTFDWGIPLAIDEDHVIYVWFDALTNYLTSVGYNDDPEKFDKYWNEGEVVHVVGKDILRFHAIIWPTILMAAGEKLPDTIFAHGWWTSEGEKMSKSKGNVVDPKKEIEKYGRDAFRYFLMKEVHFGKDGDYSQEAMIRTINSDLANDLGNLLNRTLGMVQKYFNGVVVEGKGEDKYDIQIKELFFETLDKIDKEMDHMQFSKALQATWKFVSRMNKYIDETTPWILAKDDDKKDRLAVVLYNLLEALYKIAVLVYPYMPESAAKIWQQLGVKEDINNATINDISEWGNIKYNTTVKTANPIFPRIDEDAKEEILEEEKKSKVSKKESKNKKTDKKKQNKKEIDFNEFKKVEMKVAKIIEAEKIKKADKLLKFKVEVGDEQRSVVSGLAKHYKPKELIDKKVLFVSNLKPAKLMGVLSQGMLLTTVEDNKIKLIEIDGKVPSGTIVE
ncbi:MAG: methionine--tRNA ligase [Fusobacteriota bacterium]